MLLQQQQQHPEHPERTLVQRPPSKLWTRQPLFSQCTASCGALLWGVGFVFGANAQSNNSSTRWREKKGSPEAVLV